MGWWRKFKHGYLGMDTVPHIYYFILPWVYASYMIFGNLFYHPDLNSSWLVLEPLRGFFESQGYWRQDYHEEGMSYRLFDASPVAFGHVGLQRQYLEKGVD